MLESTGLGSGADLTYRLKKTLQQLWALAPQTIPIDQLGETVKVLSKLKTVLLGGYFIGSLCSKRADDDSDGQLWSKSEIEVGQTSATRCHKSI